MANSPIETVSDTAFWVAHYRAVEGERARPLFHDPLAGVLAGEHGRKIAAAMPRGQFTAWAVALRTVIIDDFITRAIGQGIDTVLNLGAGLDTRPYRMGLPSQLNWIEVDYPRVIELKEQRLAGERPNCRLERVKLDLAEADARRQLLARVDAGAKNMLILTEGVVPYLDEAAVGALADDLHALPNAAFWIVDYFGAGWLNYHRRNMARTMRNAPFKFAPADWFAFFAAHGWKSADVRYLVEEAERLRRPVDMPLVMRLAWIVRALLSSKQKRAAMRRLAGYALLTPSR
jgi:methyltransferase (TIGR00027 family)